MKSRILGLLILFSTVPFLSNAQLPDMNFENWNTTNLYENPDNFFTSNIQSYLGFVQPNVTKVAGAQGNAARLETVADQTGDSIQGLLSSGPGIQGIPFTSLPDSIKITFRTNTQPNDSSSFLFAFKSNGFPFAAVQFQIGGTYPTFTTKSYPVFAGLPLTPDTLIMVINSGNRIGSWIEIDDITFVNSAQQLPNNGLDNWTMLSYETPQGWGTFDALAAIFNQPQSVRKNSTDVQSGSYSAEITNRVINLFGSMDTIGFMVNSDIFGSGSGSGTPYTDQPDKLTFYYKYTPMGNDSALVGVIFHKWNGSSGVSDSINGGMMLLGPASSFTKMELPFDWTGLPNPDSVLIGLAAGNELKNSGIPGSVVIFDNLMFEFNVGISTPVPAFANEVNLYPNPAGDHLYIDLSKTKMQSGQIRILNILGQPVYEGSFNGTDNPVLVDLNGYQSGTYLYEIRSGKDTFTGKFIIH